MSPPEVITPAWQVSGRVLVRRALARWRLVLLCVLVGAIAGAGTSFLLPTYFRAEAAFQAENNAPSLLSSGMAGLATQVGLLQLGSQNGAQFFGDLLPTDAVLRRVAHATFPTSHGTAPLPAIYEVSD